MRYTARIGTVFGIPLRVHATFPVILVLYAAYAWRTGSASDALLAAALVLAMFACVVLHELGHSLLIRRYGIVVRDIVLFPIGGVARAESIPRKPGQEILVAIAGPAVNFAIVAVLLPVLLFQGLSFGDDNFLVTLTILNLSLGLFNLIPAFPMDGGRILRGVLSLRLPYRVATRRARDAGQIIALGFATIAFMSPSFMMLGLVAMFVFAGGMIEERIVRTKIRLDGRCVGDLTDASAPVFASHDPVEFAVAHLGRSPAFAVAAESGSLAGVVEASDLLQALRAGRTGEPLATMARSDFPVADAGTDATRVYHHLHDAHASYAAVVKEDRFIGLFHANDEWDCIAQNALIP
jgi:Zn-dependent protease